MLQEWALDPGQVRVPEWVPVQEWVPEWVPEWEQVPEKVSDPERVRGQARQIPARAVPAPVWLLLRRPAGPDAYLRHPG